MLTLLVAHAGNTLHLHEHTVAELMAAAAIVAVFLLPRVAARLATSRASSPGTNRRR